MKQKYKIPSRDQIKKLDKQQTRAEFLLELSVLDEHEAYLQTVDKEKIIERSRKRTNGVTTPGTLFCKGPDACTFYAACPVADITNGQKEILEPEYYPLGLPCILETTYYRQKLADYLTTLNVEPTNIVEFALVEELALIELQKHRAHLIMNDGSARGGRDFLLVDQRTTQLENGVSIEETTSLHPLVDMQDRLEKRRMNILAKFMATRKDHMEMQNRFGMAKDQGLLSQTIVEIRNALQDMKALTDTEMEDII